MQKGGDRRTRAAEGHFHIARLDAHLDGAGGLILLERQDRALWDPERIACGAKWLARSAMGETFTRFHAETGIAAVHCLAVCFRETRWDATTDLYAMLERLAPSPLHTLNRALAVQESRGPAAGLDGIVPASRLAGSYLWHAVVIGTVERAIPSELAWMPNERLAPRRRVRYQWRCAHDCWWILLDPHAARLPTTYGPRVHLGSTKSVF